MIGRLTVVLDTVGVVSCIERASRSERARYRDIRVSANGLYYSRSVELVLPGIYLRRLLCCFRALSRGPRVQPFKPGLKAWFEGSPLAEPRSRRVCSCAAMLRIR